MFEHINREIDAAVGSIADDLGVSSETLYIAFFAVIMAFMAGFFYGYNISIEHFLDMINKHQLEHGLPTFNRDWTGA